MKTTEELLKALLEGIRENGEVLGSAILLTHENVVDLFGTSAESDDTQAAASGDDIPASHRNKIKKWTRVEQDWSKVHTFPVLMIDDAPTRNKVIYTAESQKKTAKSWVGTTVLFNSMGTSGLWDSGPDHKLQAASQVARLYDSKVVKTPKGQIGTLAWFYSVEDLDTQTDAFINKLEAGILREVSIHVTVPEGVICSICNDTFDKCKETSGGWHYPGEKSGKQICYMSTGTGKLGPLELSMVACPGSVNAHVMADDDVAEYVSLREALGGSREAIDQLIPPQQEKDMTEAEKLAARTKLVEAAKAAGVTIAAFVENAENKVAVEAADVTAETLSEAFTSEQLAEGKKKSDDPPDDDKDKETDDEEKKNKKSGKKEHLFGAEDCPVCGRSESAAPTGDDSEKIKQIKEEFQTQVQAVVKKTESALAAAQIAVEEAEERAKERDDLFADLVEQTVTIAVEAGHKKFADSATYREELEKLPYSAIREIREAFKTASKPTPEKQRAGLEESMEARFRRTNGQTSVTVKEDGTKSISSSRRPRFAAK